MANAVAVIMFVGVVAYAVFGGADFGAGFWDLTAGGAERGKEPRHAIDLSIGPVWEANHTWLIYCLVLLWTGFPRAFVAITTTLYVPLGLAVLGIVLRGAGFAFRKVTEHTPHRRLFGVAFAASSAVTPYCFGSIAGGIASGRVPSRGDGDPVTSWLNPTSALGGVLAVLVCAYLAAVFLTADTQRDGDAHLSEYFRRRALATAACAGLLSVAGVFVLRADARRLFDGLASRGLGLLVLAALGGLTMIWLLLTGAYRPLRPAAILTVAAVVGGWGVAQYPLLLGTHLSINDAASPDATLWVLIGVAIAALVLIAPSLALLFLLFERGRLTAGP
ncbi:cytochrome d ubiquinol oxidase subunit II [Streptomyces sp. NBC_01190]|uniref:cytochrome d ubiquinol oxidase subunit II n=1 Tax=Streptomyces sp. NBC_01190 TaxID=2903767 RepID=UPI0038675726|nr:cytochrome d ubiquinol oxidase subunit II [Streptomyces sp. NBC_01190]